MALSERKVQLTPIVLSMFPVLYCYIDSGKKNYLSDFSLYIILVSIA